MSKRIIKKDKVERLPGPSELAEFDDTVRVTLLLSKDSVDFFKQQADKHNSKYQRMIRNLIDKYVEQCKQ